MPDGSELPRVALNAALLSLTRDYRAAGLHRYIIGLGSALAERTDLRLTMLAADAEARQVLPQRGDVYQIPRFARRPTGRIIWEQLLLPPALLARPVDLLHCPAYAVPMASPVPAVVTVHDLSFFRMPETLPPAKARYLRLATRYSVRRAAATIAVSEFTRRELGALLGAPSARIHVVHNGVDESFSRASPEEAAAYRRRAQLPERFLLTVGTHQPRKNLGLLLASYAGLLERTPDAPHLAIAGGHGWGAPELDSLVAELGLEERVLLLGHVDADDLPLLYSAASAFAFPSRYEGFGLPVVEAMACGAPVIASSAASLPEVAGDAAILVAPDDVGGWTDALVRLLEDEAVAAALVQAGYEQASHFSWDRAAEQTMEVYRWVLRPGAKHAPPGGGQ